MTNAGFGNRGREVAPRRRAISAFRRLADRLESWHRPGDPLPDERAADIPPEESSILLRVIERDVIPRLLRSPPAPEAAAGRPGPRRPGLDASDHALFLEEVRKGSAASLRRFIAQRMARGVEREAILLDLVANAARRLGELWDEDLCDFAEVTIGLCRLHQLLREPGPLADDDPAPPRPDAPRILLATACGDPHLLGVVLVADFFRRAGWRTWSEPGASGAQLAAILAGERFDVLGLSASRTTCCGAFARQIEALRLASLNPSLQVLVGGRLFDGRPALFTMIGADGVAPDAKSAPAAAGSLLEGLEGRAGERVPSGD